ncbi:hypothetical protein GQ457_08G007270 [Hibiscus cannabinus]
MSGQQQVGFKTVGCRSGSVATVTGLIRFRVNISRLQIGFGSLQPRVKPGSDSIGFQSGFQPETLIQMPLEPVLEFHKLAELKLEILDEYRHWQGTWVIQFLYCAPNLETLHLALPVPRRGFKPLPEEVPPCLIFHLKEIKIKYFEGNEHMFEMISYFLNHASVLEALMIGTEEDEELSIPETLIRVPFEPVIGFHNLVELELKTHKEYCDWQGTWVIQFLWCAPNLETLHLDLPVPLRGFKPLPEEVPPCLILHLKEIKIRYFEGNEHMFGMISYFLNHASVLEALMIGIEEIKELSIGKKLLGLPRNSKKCRVVPL